MTNNRRQHGTIYLIRHGETQWNLENRLQGSKDLELTEKRVKEICDTSHFMDEII
ncbi:histidine phosphatase family protein [Bacillus suaedae]|uniref:Histidine phosphatase family protein n=1 Tax=Halalkalibacter suaedae TaxID=2822140 RepID=A0A941AR06_9BACI|nr:histidine phosphatase family protein [Bacillus suaedae]